MGNLGEQVVTIATAIIGVAILAVIVSRNSNTVGVVNAAGGAFSSALQTAVSPVTGFTGGVANTNLQYASAFNPSSLFSGVGGFNA